MQQTDNLYFMKQAFREAEKAYANGEVPVGAIVVYGEKIISRGYNQVELLNDCTAHAEMIALTSAFNELGAKYLPEATIYITLEPCIMCCGALYWSKIGKIIYGASDIKNGFSKWLPEYQTNRSQFPFHPKTIIENGWMENEIVKLLKSFFEERRKQKR